VATAPEPAGYNWDRQAADTASSTYDRLLAAATASCAERGFEAATVADIARRADVSAPAIYNHFGSKDDLMVAAGRWALDRIGPPQARLGALDVIRAFLAEDFAGARRLLMELHAASHRHPRLHSLLAEWNGEHTEAWRRRVTAAARATGTPLQRGEAAAVVRTFFAFLLGICQIDHLASTPADRAAFARHAERLAAATLPEEIL
jgi:AcrR family transcriptional regulator